MKYSEIQIDNPIDLKSINKFIKDLGNCETPQLLINIGDHHFESIEAIQELKTRLLNKAAILDRFEKIAIIHPPGFPNESEDEDIYRYFSEQKEAVKWLNKK